HWPDGQFGQEFVAVLVHRRDLDPLADQATLAGGQVSGHARTGGGPSGNRDDASLERLAQCLLAGPAEGCLGLGIPVDDPSLRVDRNVRLACAVDDQAGLLLAGPERQLGFLLGGDIDHEAPVAQRLSGVGADHHALVADPLLATIASAHPVLADASRADLAMAVELLVLKDLLTVVGVDVADPEARVGLP